MRRHLHTRLKRADTTSQVTAHKTLTAQDKNEQDETATILNLKTTVNNS